MTGLFQAGSSVRRNGMAVQNNDSATTGMGNDVGQVTRVYGDPENPVCDVSFADGSVATGVAMQDLNAA